MGGVMRPDVRTEVIELWDEVADGAAGVRLAKGRAAVHAACGLALQLERFVLRVDLQIIELALGRRAVRLRLPLILDKAAQFIDRRCRAVLALHNGHC